MEYWNNGMMGKRIWNNGTMEQWNNDELVKSRKSLIIVIPAKVPLLAG
jgi:hypothetical protein